MQHRSLYIASIQPRSGSLIVATGIMEMLKGRFEKVAFFRPVLSDNRTVDESIRFMREHFDLDIDEHEAAGFSVDTYLEAFARGEHTRLIEAIIEKVERLHTSYDFVLIEGYPRDLLSHAFDFDLNLEIAKQLSAAFIPVLNAFEKKPTEIWNEVRIVTENVKSEGCALLAAFVNRCDEKSAVGLKKNAEKELPDTDIFFLRNEPELERASLAEIVSYLDAKVVIGEKRHLQRLVYGTKIAAMGAKNFLSHMQEGNLIIVPGDRCEIILLTLLSYYGKNHPNISAILLSGGIAPSEPLLALIKDFEEVTIPMFLVETESYETAIMLEKLPPRIDAASERKITLAKALFDEAVDKERLSERLVEQKSDMLTPMMFRYHLIEQARRRRQRITLPESEDDRILYATEIIVKRRIADITLLGEEEKIRQRANKLGISLEGASFQNPNDDTLIKRFSERFHALREKKGLTLKAAQDALAHRNYFATMMVYEGLADGMVSGAVHTTADTIRPALQIIKTEPDISVVSSVFFMCLDTRVLVYGDCAINLDPTAEELAQIAISSAKTAQQFGIEPRVALLSYASGDSGSGPEVEKVRKATRLAQQMRPDLPIEGPMQYDAAIDPEVAKKKLPQSKIAGRATVFVFPDLNTGNNTYKAVQRSTGALAIGPVLQGLKLPVNDLSRGCSVDDIVNTVAITAIQAQQVKQ